MSCWLRRSILLLLVLCPIGCHRGANPEAILIGHLAPFSGPDKDIGEHARQAILLAVEDINKEENRIQGRKINVLHPQYAPEDPDNLQPVAVRLVTVNRVVSLLGGADLGEAERQERAVQPYDVPLVTFADLPPELLGENVFSVNAGLAFQGLVLARFVKQELKANQVALLVDGRQASCTTLANIFNKEFSKTNMSHVHEWNYKNSNDLSDLAERVKKLQPSAIVHAGMVNDLGRLREKLQAAGIKAPIIFGGDAEHLSLTGAQREASNGVYVATPYIPSNMPAENEKFVKEYQERFKQLPDLHAALAYDGLQVVFEAMRRAKAFQPAKIRAALAEMTTKPFEKSLSGSWTFDKNHSARRPLFVGKMENGRVSNARPYPAEEK